MKNNIIKIRLFKNGNIRMYIDYDLVRKDFMEENDIKSLPHYKMIKLYTSFLYYFELKDYYMYNNYYIHYSHYNILYDIFSLDLMLASFQKLLNCDIKYINLTSIKSKRKYNSLMNDFSNNDRSVFY